MKYERGSCLRTLVFQKVSLKIVCFLEGNDGLCTTLMLNQFVGGPPFLELCAELAGVLSTPKANAHYCRPSTPGLYPCTSTPAGHTNAQSPFSNASF